MTRESQKVSREHVPPWRHDGGEGRVSVPRADDMKLCVVLHDGVLEEEMEEREIEEEEGEDEQEGERKEEEEKEE